MKTTHRFIPALCAVLVHIPLLLDAQVDSGSNGSDGAFNPTQNVTIDMSDHPDGIYQYTSVNIPSNVTVTFVPNAKNTPIVWLVQSDCIIAGNVILNASPGGAESSAALDGGPGGYRGGNGGTVPTSGLGPGGGAPSGNSSGANASYATKGGSWDSSDIPGATYGNRFVLPILGGSGGGGAGYGSGAGGGGGGGAILIAASGTLTINGYISAQGSAPNFARCGLNCGVYGGAGSGGAIRLVATTVAGSGQLHVEGGFRYSPGNMSAGAGWARLDAFADNFGGSVSGSFSRGFQPIIIPAPGQGAQLAIQSVAGNAVSSNPSGVLASPDVIIPAQINNPVPIVVSCTNIPLNSEVTVTVHPVNGSDVQGVGTNNTGTSASSTATISLNVPRGGGIIYASVVTGINGGTASTNSKNKTQSYARTGLTAFGERFAKIETKAFLGGKQETTFITASGKRYSLR